ncbi:unnamed protein product [Didymodactylos carnosus]|uniref:Uncharacterized protein n=1 Tax=Didymodactylos carnosus TaxID=1234261 RepID=A0A8S2EQV2_9BILA|nr:unnamed protein product [Didymodactylos carnosus]CAF4042932.1 unnamed protein product [Didymodactylos carnosus]
MLHRPIVVQSKYYADFPGNLVNDLENKIGGVYLPLTVEMHACTKDPIVLCHHKNHFCALLPSRTANQSEYVCPLLQYNERNRNNENLRIRFCKDAEKEPRNLVSKYLNCKRNDIIHSDMSITTTFSEINEQNGRDSDWLFRQDSFGKRKNVMTSGFNISPKHLKLQQMQASTKLQLDRKCVSGAIKIDKENISTFDEYESDSDTESDADERPTIRIIKNRNKSATTNTDIEHNYSTERKKSTQLTVAAVSELLGVDVPPTFKKSVQQKRQLKQSSNATHPQSSVIHHQTESDNEQPSAPINLPKKRDFTVSEMIVGYVKDCVNPYCTLVCIENRCSRAKIPKILLRCIGHCSMKLAGCPFEYEVIVRSNGTLRVTCNGSIIHAQQRLHARRIREPEQEILRTDFSKGVNPTLVFHERLLKIKPEALKAGNLDGVGKTVHIYHKIVSSIAGKLKADCFNNLSTLKKEYERTIMPNTPVSGIIQFISYEPCYIICINSVALSFWKRYVNEEDAEITWDATGGIIQCKATRKKVLYYEMTAANPVKRATSIPLTFLLSENHDLTTVKHWMELFKALYKKQFAQSNETPFPVPRYIINDRAQVFVQAALRVFNNETFTDFNQRAYRIITGSYTSDDLRKTIPHACTAHIMKDFKILSRKVGQTDKKEIQTITHDQNHLISIEEDAYDIQHIGDDDDTQEKATQNTRTWMSEEQTLNEFDSNIKTDMNKIFQKVYHQYVTAGADSSSLNEKNDLKKLTQKQSFLDIALKDLCTETLAIQKQAGTQIAHVMEFPTVRGIEERWSQRKYGFYQKYTAAADKTLSILLDEVKFYCGSKKIIIWENKNKKYSLENSLFQAVTYVQRIQANMTNMNSIALTEPHESLHFLLTQALSHKKTMKEKMIIDVLNKLTTDIEQLSRKNSFVNLYPFIERFVFPIINTNVTLTTMLYSTCGAYGNSCEFLNDHKMLTIQANDVRHTKQLMEQILLSSDIKRKCPYCKDDTTPRTFHNAILICPKVIFVFKTQNSDIDKNLSYLEHINFNTYLDQNLVCVKYYSIYRLVSTVYEKEPNEYGAIAYCKDL